MQDSFKYGLALFFIFLYTAKKESVILDVYRGVKVFISYISFAILWFFSQFISPKFARVVLIWGLKSRIFALDTRGKPMLRTRLLGRDLKSPIGLACDFDYKGDALDLLVPLGLGFGELGSYTVNANTSAVRTSFVHSEKAVRIFTAETPNPGITKAVQIMAARRHLPHLTGVSLVSFGTEEINTKSGGSLYTYLEEFRQMSLQIAPCADYVVINLSHPNSSLCQLVADESSILPLIQTVQEAVKLAAPIVTPKIVVKVPHDMTDLEVKTVTDILLKAKVDAVIVGGATKNTSQKMNDAFKFMDYSSLMLGRPLSSGMLRLVRRFYTQSQGQLCIIASGGIQSGKDAYEAIAAGASAVEVCSALLLKGPGVVAKINKELIDLMRKNNIKSVKALVGTAADSLEGK